MLGEISEAMRDRLAALLAEVENSEGAEVRRRAESPGRSARAGDGRKKLTPEEIERKRREAEELGRSLGGAGTCPDIEMPSWAKATSARSCRKRTAADSLP